MTCDGKERECIYYFKEIHTRATFWHGSTYEEAKNRYLHHKGDYTIDLGKRYEEDPGTCICDEGCEKWIDGAKWGKAIESAHRKTLHFRNSRVPHIILLETHRKVTEITATVQCVNPEEEIKHTLKKGEDVEEVFALLRERANMNLLKKS